MTGSAKGWGGFLAAMLAGAAMADDVPTAPGDPSTTAAEAAVETVPVDGVADAATAPESAGGGSRLVEEIVVTAQKREENLQDVPISVAAFSDGMLDARGITDPKDLGQITPGLTFSQAVGFSLIYLRGVGSDAFLLGDPSVAYYVDNIYFPFAQGLAQQFGALDRIEVLKGPQGTLFGRNAVGGAINVITRAPDLDEASVSLQSSYGDYNQWYNRAHVNIPLTETLAMSVSALYNSEDFHQQGEVGGEKFDPEIVARAARVKVRWRPIDELDITVSGLRYRQHGAGTLFQLNAEPSPLATALGVEPQTGYDGALSDPIYQTIDNRVVYGDAKWTTPLFDVRVLGSNQRIETGADYDYDGSPRALVGFEGPCLCSDIESAELQILSNDGTWGSDRFQWILGGYYFHSKAGYEGGLRNKVAAVDALTSTLLGLLPDGGVPPAILTLVPDGNLVAFGRLATLSSAAFGQATYSFTDWLSLTLGARYQEERRGIIEAYNAAEQADGTTVPVFPVNPASNLLHDTTTSFNPKASLEFRVLDDTLLYVTYQEAIKSATFNPLKIAQAVDYVKPEETTAYEVGVKTSFLDGLATVSAAAFQYDIHNLQVQFVSLINGGVVTFENARRAKVKGVDFDATVQILPSTFDDLVLAFGGAYIHGRYTDYRNGSGFNETTGIFSVDNDFSGNDIVRSPEWSGSATLSKTWTVPGGTLEVAGDVYLNSGYYYTAQNTDKAEQPSYEVFGAHASYLYDPWGLRVTVFGKNLADEFYTTGVLQQDFGTNVSLAPPITAGVRLNWDF